MSEPLRLGLIGCGHWGKNYAATIPTLSGAVLSWCADPSEAARERARNLNPGAHVTADFNDLLAAEDCDAVVIAAPPTSHAAIARAVLAAKKPVLVEKPLATTLADARELVDLARDAGVVAMSAHVYLFHPVAREIERRVRDGSVGALRFMSASRMFTRLAASESRPDVDALWDLAPNDVAMFSLFAGALPERVFCRQSAFFRSDQADAAFALLEFPGNVTAELRVSWDYPRRERLVTVVGAQASLHFDDDARERLLLYAGPPSDLSGRRSEPIACAGGSALAEEIRAFVASVRAGKANTAPFETGLDVVRVLAALSASAATGVPVRV